MTIQSQTSNLRSRGIDCVYYKWTPEEKTDPQEVRGVVVIYHGFGAHSRYPTVHYASTLLANNGFVVYAMDLPGHGASPGVRGLLTSVKDVIEDGMAIATHAMEDSSTTRTTTKLLPLFLVGSSMGGAIALSVARNMQDKVKGVVMLAPMLSLNVGSAARIALRLLSIVLPQVPLIPSSATNAESQYRDEVRRTECESDALTYKGNMRPQSALTCIQMTDYVQQSFHEIAVPFLCMIANEDVVVDNSITNLLMTTSPSQDKTLKSYAALHGLMCEPLPLLHDIENDLVQWLQSRCL